MKIGIETEYRFALNDPELSNDFWKEFFCILDKDDNIISMKGLTAGSDYENDFIRFLGNGGKLYPEIRYNEELKEYVAIEYATPECSTPEELCNYNYAGLFLICYLLNITTHKFIKRKRNISIDLFCATRNSWDSLCGCHENYEVSNDLYEILNNYDSDLVKRFWLPFIISRNNLAGGGWFISDNLFQLSQRGDFTKHYIKKCESCLPLSIRERGVIDSRDEHFGRNKRLHLVFGDANISKKSQHFKIFTTFHILTILENCLKNGNLTNTNSELANLYLDKEFSIDDFKNYNSLNNFEINVSIQQEILNKISKFINNEIFIEWTKLLDVNHEDFKNEFDWVYKKYTLDHTTKDKTKLNWILQRVYCSKYERNSEILPEINQFFQHLSPYRFSYSDLDNWLELINTPPNTQSAIWRSDLIKTDNYKAISWHVAQNIDDELEFRNDLDAQEVYRTQLQFILSKITKEQKLGSQNPDKIDEYKDNYNKILNEIQNEETRIESLIGISNLIPLPELTNAEYLKYLQIIQKKHDEYHVIHAYCEYIEFYFGRENIFYNSEIKKYFKIIFHNYYNIKIAELKENAKKYLIETFNYFTIRFVKNYSCLKTNNLLGITNKEEVFKILNEKILFANKENIYFDVFSISNEQKRIVGDSIYNEILSHLEDKSKLYFNYNKILTSIHFLNEFKFLEVLEIKNNLYEEIFKNDKTIKWLWELPPTNHFEVANLLFKKIKNNDEEKIFFENKLIEILPLLKIPKFNFKKIPYPNFYIDLSFPIIDYSKKRYQLFKIINKQLESYNLEKSEISNNKFIQMLTWLYGSNLSTYIFHKNKHFNILKNNVLIHLGIYNENI
ncbi:MAG: proteasome accessory factor PafA2 family protein [bacterium]